ncbi:Methyltransferase domain-containing protein [Rhizobiales bacterium GAS191]|nr:Methyltransferase domain-containing protein [Rhizobiales bacterium GAS188]SEE43970.1 Methyltransferase domain-containing protein [Rhizobiales bacterium GAS191]
MLLCPVTKQALTLLSGDEIVQANGAIGSGLLRHTNGNSRPLESGALGTHDRGIIYRVEDDIACLLPELAISSTHDHSASLNAESAGVQRFYDEYGWLKSQSGCYNDTADFTDTRAVSVYYVKECNRRIARQLKSGRYLLDAASGAIPHPDYIPFSENYDFRVCLDFSITALREARAKLGSRGLYVLGDMTRLPFASDSIDDVISLHTIYHIPEKMLSTAVDELVRVVRSDGRVVIVSVWASSPLMDVAMKAKRALGRLKRRILGSGGTQHIVASEARQDLDLYFAPFGYDRYLSEIASRHSATLHLWSSTNADFQKAFFANNRVGLLSAKLVIAAEQLLEPLAARYGQYPMFVLSKKLTEPRPN